MSLAGAERAEVGFEPWTSEPGESMQLALHTYYYCTWLHVHIAQG
jgi:hypothetical protein